MHSIIQITSQIIVNGLSNHRWNEAKCYPAHYSKWIWNVNQYFKYFSFFFFLKFHLGTYIKMQMMGNKCAEKRSILHTKLAAIKIATRFIFISVCTHFFTGKNVVIVRFCYACDYAAEKTHLFEHTFSFYFHEQITRKIPNNSFGWIFIWQIISRLSKMKTWMEMMSCGHERIQERAASRKKPRSKLNKMQFVKNPTAKVKKTHLTMRKFSGARTQPIKIAISIKWRFIFLFFFVFASNGFITQYPLALALDTHYHWNTFSHRFVVFTSENNDFAHSLSHFVCLHYALLLFSFDKFHFWNEFCHSFNRKMLIELNHDLCLARVLKKNCHTKRTEWNENIGHTKHSAV